MGGPRKYPARVVSGAVVLAVMLGFVSAARAQDAELTPSASVALSERRAAEAFQAYSRDDYALAISLYLEAYKAAPSGSILYNVARIYDTKLENPVQAAAYYRRYLAAPGAHPDLVQLANQRLRQLPDGQPPPASSLEARAPAASETILRERAPSDPTRGDSPARSGGWSSSRRLGVAAGALGLLGLGVGSWFGLAAMSDARTVNESCDGNACTSQAAVDAAHAASSHATLSTVGFAAGVPLLVIGAALVYAGRERSSPHPAALVAPRPTSPAASVRLETRPMASGLSLRISGRW